MSLILSVRHEWLIGWDSKEIERSFSSVAQKKVMVNYISNIFVNDLHSVFWIQLNDRAISSFEPLAAKWTQAAKLFMFCWDQFI